MRWSFLGLCLMLTRIRPTTSTITLSKYQPVTGFSVDCTNAYNTPLSSCTTLDFAEGKPCSQSCIKFLDNLTATIQRACRGAKVSTNTLMGMFFTFDGTKAMCPNAQGSDGSGTANGVDGQLSITVTSKIKPSRIPEPIQDRPTPTPEATTPEPTATFSSAVHEGSLGTFTTSVTPLDSATAATTTVTTIPLSLLTAASITTAGSPESTAKPENLQASDGDGGGTPFDITSSSDHNLRPMSLRASMILGFVILTCLI